MLADVKLASDDELRHSSEPPAFGVSFFSQHLSIARL